MNMVPKITPITSEERIDSRAQRPPKKLLSLKEFIAGFTSPDYLLDGILQRRFIYSMTGQTGHGKTAIAIVIARMVGSSSQEESLGGHRADKGNVIYFAGETDVQMRVIGDDILHADNNAKVWFYPGTFSVEEMRATVEAKAKEIGDIALVIVDTSAAYFNGKDELSNTEMGDHARKLRTLTEAQGGPCVLVLCHPIKRVNDPSELLPRGGGAFLAEVDGNLTVWKHDDTLLRLHHSDKLRGPGFEPITMRLEKVTTTRLMDKKGRLVPTVRAVWLNEHETERESTRARDDEDALLNAMIQKGRSISELAQACAWLTSTGEPQKSKVDRVMKRLLEQKLVKKNRDKWELTDKGKTAATDD
jgi:AAA domain